MNGQQCRLRARLLLSHWLPPILWMVLIFVVSAQPTLPSPPDPWLDLLLKKLGRYGYFLACTGFPECMNTKSVPLADCPRDGCDGKIVARKKQGGRGKEFYGCTNYPDCDFISHFKPTESHCPKCGWFLVQKTDKKVGDHKACINPECDFLHSPESEEANG